jgi:hypothetical protein
MAITYSIPVGPPTLILGSNTVYALPMRACLLVSSGACEVSLDGTAWAAHTSGQVALGSFVRAAAPVTVACKPT